ncbi:MAG: transposase, partial [Bacteroidales bacterium]|nr:transposase [Bacteroidales bacterium]MCF8377529.1 transposase [Bacteroidales bacterium]MCF8401805.1 transposase [Bacteroidales bacterium]
LKDEIYNVTPKSAIGKAIAYTLKLWPRLIRYTQDGRFHIDNNLVENSIRPVALGRKNYLFAGSHDAAQNAAMIYSLLATCKINKVEPFQWLKNTLDTIPDHPANQLDKLLPRE